MLNAASVPGQVVVEAAAGDIIPLYNEEIFAEYRDVLSRPKFKFEKEAVKALLEAIVSGGFPWRPEWWKKYCRIREILYFMP